MKLINSNRINSWKTSVEKAVTESRPLGVNSLKAYIGQPLETCIDFFRKATGQSFGNASIAYQGFYSWIQWLALEYVGCVNDLGWQAFVELCQEYSGGELRIELTQAQYNIIDFNDNDFIEVKARDEVQVFTDTGFDDQHDLGYVPAMSSAITVVGTGYRSQRLFGVVTKTGVFSYSGTTATPRRVMPAFSDVNGFQIGQSPTNILTLHSRDSSQHSHLCMLWVIDPDSGENIEYQPGFSHRGYTQYIPDRILNMKRQSASVRIYRKPYHGAVLPPRQAFAINPDLGLRNQNFVMHNIGFVPDAMVEAHPEYCSAYGIDPVAHPGQRLVDPEIERCRRYTLTVTTEPYQVFSALDQGNSVEITAVNSAGSQSQTPENNRFIRIRGNHSSLVAVDTELSKSRYNTDVIDTLTIVDTSYLAEGGSTLSWLDQQGLRVNAGIGDQIIGTRYLFELTADFLGDSLYEAMRYRYPAGRILVIGAGLVMHRATDAKPIAIKLYCAGVNPDEFYRYSITALVKSTSYSSTKPIPLVLDSNGEKLGPVVKVPGLQGYVRLIRRLRDISPQRQGFQDAGVYEVEIPYGFLSGYAFWNSAAITTTTNVLTQTQYIKAGSWRRHVSLDPVSSDPVDPTIIDNNWIGVNERVAIADLSTSASPLLGPSDFFISETTSGFWDSQVFNGCAPDFEVNTKVELGLLYVNAEGLRNTAECCDLRRLCAMSNSYWVSTQGQATAKPGMEYPAFIFDFDMDDIGGYAQAKTALAIAGRWFVSRVIGGGSCDSSVDSWIAHIPFLKTDLGLWLRQNSGYQRQAVNSRDSTIDAAVGINLLVQDTLGYYSPPGTGTYQVDNVDPNSGLVRVRLVNSTGMTTVDDLYAAGLGVANDMIYNANLQCLFGKTADSTSLYCQTHSYKIIGSEFTNTLVPGAMVLTLVIVADDGTGQSQSPVGDAVTALGLSSINIDNGNVVGFCNVIAPRSNGQGMASTLIETSRVLSPYAKVPNIYNGDTVVEYIGIYAGDDQASAMVAAASPQAWMYYNGVENAFFVYIGGSWQLFYSVTDWTGIKSRYIDAMAGDFRSATGVAPGGVAEYVFGLQPKRIPLPEHCQWYSEQPPINTFVNGIMDGNRPSNLSLRYTGFLTKPPR